MTRGPDHRLVPNVAAGANDGVVANLYARLDDGQRLNRNTVAELSARIHNGARMNTGREGDRLWREFEHDPLERLCRICNANLRNIDRLRKIPRNKNRRSAGLTKQPNVFSICKETDFSLRRVPERCRAADLQRWVAE